MIQKSDQTRLNKFLALNLGISRREADDLISNKKVTVNDHVADLGLRISQNDVISVNKKLVKNTTKYEYIALNKPVGYICSRKHQGNTPTIYELLPTKYHQLKTVGRLDKDSSGLILLTNNGDFTYKMTHPSFYKTKIYSIHLDHDLEPIHQQMISDYGITLSDGISKFQLERMNETDRKNWLITMHEGRNRQIRRTFDALGYKVLTLHRTNFGNYALGDILPGKFKVINIQ